MACFLQAANNVIQIKFVLFSNLACMTGNSSISRMPGCGPNALPKNWI